MADWLDGLGGEAAAQKGHPRYGYTHARRAPSLPPFGALARSPVGDSTLPMLSSPPSLDNLP